MTKFNLIFLLVYIGFSTVLFAQKNGVVYEMKDTVLASKFIAESEALKTKKEFAIAFTKLDSAEVIYKDLLGEDQLEMAKIWHLRGTICDDQGRYDLALEYNTKALKIRISHLGETHLEVAKSYNNIGLLWRKKGEFEKAIDFHERDIKILEMKLGPYHIHIAQSYYNLGLVYHNQGRYAKALECFEKGLDSRKGPSDPEHAFTVNLYNGIGVEYGNLGQLEKALECYQKGVEVSIEQLGPSHSQVALLRVNLSTGLLNLGNYKGAKEELQEALKIYTNLGLENDLGGAGVYHELAKVLENQGQYDKAIDYNRKALEIRLKQLSEFHPMVAVSYNGLGVNYVSKGQYEKAIEYYQKALSIALKNYDDIHPMIADYYNNIGVAYMDEGRYEKALNYNNKALEMRLELYDVLSPSLSDSYNNLGITYKGLGQYRKAEEFYQKSLDIRIKLLGESHPSIAQSYNNLGNMQMILKQHEESIRSHKKAVSIRLDQLGKFHPLLARSYNNLGNTYHENQQYSEAIESYQKALKTLNYTNLPELERITFLRPLIFALHSLSATYQASYVLSHSESSLKKSIQFADEAINVIKYQSTIYDEKSVQAWRDLTYPIFEQGIGIFLISQRQHNLYEAFSFAEDSKAGLLQAQISASLALQFSGLPDSLLNRESDIRADITFHDKERFDAIVESESEMDSTVLAIDGKLFTLRQQRDSLIKTFETQYPDYYRLKYDTRVIDVPEVQKDLLTRNQTLVEYFVGDSSIFVFVIRKDLYEVKEIKKDFPLEQWVESMRKDMSKNYRVGIKNYVDKGHQLYQKLIEPVEDLLTEELIIIPDGALGYIPFEALLTQPVVDPLKFKSYPYLLKDKQISYCYSATLLRELIQKKHQKEPTKSLLAFAPFYDGDTTLFANLFSPYSEERTRSEGLENLPHTGEEVYGVSKIMNGEMYTDQEATEDRFVDLAGDYRVVHLATHGRANDRVGDYSFLAFTEIKDSIENELLYVRDLYNLQLNADMVVLSACETGIGELQRGEGIISLARGFTYAGAKSILTTLWRVNDERTKDLMLLFYEDLKKGLRKDAALRQAKLRFIQGLSGRNTRYAHPYFWSGLIAIGDMSKIDP